MVAAALESQLTPVLMMQPICSLACEQACARERSKEPASQIVCPVELGRAI